MPAEVATDCKLICQANRCWGLFGGVGRGIIAEPLHRHCMQLINEVALHFFPHKARMPLPHQVGPGRCIATTAVQGEVMLSLAPSSLRNSSRPSSYAYHWFAPLDGLRFDAARRVV